MDITMTTEPSVGKPMDRVDGRLKVTGGAVYSAEMPVANVAHAVMITSTIAKGHIARVDARAAQAAPGVLAVMTAANAPRLAQRPGTQGANGEGASDRVLSVLQDTLIVYNNQPIGVVIADTLEHATHAAALVHYEYAEEKPNLDVNKGKIYTPKNANREPADTLRGDPKSGESLAKAKVDETYYTPVENHNPMEPHATLAVWDGPDKLTLYDATQGIFGVQKVVSKAFGLPPENVRCVTYFVGGGFGCKGSTWSHVVLSAMAAKMVGRPVKLVLTRQQMFGPVGFRPQTQQKLLFGADQSGVLTVANHDSLSQTSTFDEFVEPAAITTRMLYDCPNQSTTHQLSRIDAGTPTYMRAPGEASGTFALESAMDELSYALQIDPLALRLKNYAEEDPEEHKPWSSKSLRQCYQQGADRFGWATRTAAPRSMRAPDGRLLGMGMATATYPTNRSEANALARIMPDGTALVLAGSQDIGTGTYTIMTQIAADALGLPPDRVRFELGDTKMPQTPVSGGSMTAASTGSAVRAAGQAARDKAISLAVADTASPLSGMAATDVDVVQGKLVSKTNPAVGETYTALLARQKLPNLEASAKSGPGPDHDQYSMHSFGAIFAEVLVDPDLGEIRVSRLVGAYAAGHILNAKTGRSQLLGGIVFGVGMAMLEQTITDARWGRVVNADLAEYHIPVNADIPHIDIITVDEDDPHVNPLGAKGIGEIGITGVPAAIANAVYHATGKRVRDLPITLDKVL